MARPHILLVEDDQQLSANISDILDLFGLAFEVVRDGALALDAVLRHRPNLVLLDMRLPNRSGLEILADIRADDRIAHTNVIVLTANQFLNPSDVAQADALVFKPFRLETLRDAIEIFLPASVLDEPGSA